MYFDFPAGTFLPSLCVDDTAQYDAHAHADATPAHASAHIGLDDFFAQDLEHFFQNLTQPSTPVPADTHDQAASAASFFLSMACDRSVDPSLFAVDADLLTLLEPPSPLPPPAPPLSPPGHRHRSSPPLGSSSASFSADFDPPDFPSRSLSPASPPARHHHHHPHHQHQPPPSSKGAKPKFYSRSGQVADPTRGPCHNCMTTLTCYWRKLKGLYYCNACTLFYKRNKYHRSVDDTDKPIKRRNRKSKYASSYEFDS